MALIDAFLQEAVPFNICLAVRTDSIAGTGTAQDPFNASARLGVPLSITLAIGGAAPLDREAVATAATPHGFATGDLVTISGVTGDDAEIWNGTFGIYGVSDYSFKYYMKKPPAPFPPGSPICNRLTLLFDQVMRDAPANIKIHIGPGVFQTRGFAPNDARGWQPKTGQNIVGAGIDVTTVQLVGAVNPDQHYHVVGMPIAPSGSTAIAPLKHFEISDLTIDCNVDNQSGRPDPGYANVACGAVRLLGDHARIRNVKAINWGTKSLKQGCFVLSIIQASGRPSGGDGNPVLTETQDNGIEDCICILPSKNNARETTVLHLGGLPNATNRAQGFGTGAFIRKNFVDCQYLSSTDLAHPLAVNFSSQFVTSKSGTEISGNTGTFVGKRLHFRIGADIQTFVRLYNPKNPASRWNGYFPIKLLGATDDTLVVALDSSSGTNDDSSLVIMGTEFRAIAVSSGVNAVVEQNQIHNCWIGGPYQSPMDDSVSEPTVPPTLAPRGTPRSIERAQHPQPHRARQLLSQRGRRPLLQHGRGERLGGNPYRHYLPPARSSRLGRPHAQLGLAPLGECARGREMVENTLAVHLRRICAPA